MRKESLKSNLVMVGVAVLALLCVPVASAGELVAARPVLGFASSFSDTIVVQTAIVVRGNGVTAGDLPSAYLFWSEDGSKFYVQRYNKGTLETSPFPIPANSSLTIPAPDPILVNHNGTQRWEHHIWLNATTVVDSVFVLPLDR